MKLTKKEYQDIKEQYFKVINIQHKIHGWPGYDVFMNPQDDAIHLSKIVLSFPKAKKEPSIKQIEKQFEIEFKKRVTEKNKYCSDPYNTKSGIRGYLLSQMVNDQIGLRKEIQRLMIVDDLRAYLLKKIIDDVEDLQVNELFQRLKDYDCLEGLQNKLRKRLKD